MENKTDPALAAWRESLSCLIHPYLPMMATLQEMEGRLVAVSAFLESLNADDKGQAAQGVVVGTMAVEYADKLLDHFGLWDGPPEVPAPTNLTQARMMVDNVLVLVCEQIMLGQMAGAEDDDEDVPGTADSEAHAGNGKPQGEEAASDAATGSTGLVVDRGTFSVHWREKTCPLGHTKEFLFIEYLSRKPDRYFSVADLIDAVWEGDDTEPNTIQKTVSNLRKKLRQAEMGDLTIQAERGHYRMKLPSADRTAAVPRR
jgi:hypothetical protein